MNNNIKKYTLLKFSASWCSPCRVISNMFETYKDEIESTFKDVSFTTLDVDESNDENVKYEIRSVPTLILIETEKFLTSDIIWRHSGTLTKEELFEKLNITKNN